MRSDIDGFAVVICKAVDFRDMLAIASVICSAKPSVERYALRRASDISRTRSVLYQDTAGVYITRRKALYHVDLHDCVRQTTLSTWVITPKGIKIGQKRGWKLQKVYF